jgi:hypothetical protein
VTVVYCISPRMEVRASMIMMKTKRSLACSSSWWSLIHSGRRQTHARAFTSQQICRWRHRAILLARYFLYVRSTYCTVRTSGAASLVSIVDFSSNSSRTAIYTAYQGTGSTQARSPIQVYSILRSVLLIRSLSQVSSASLLQ